MSRMADFNARSWGGLGRSWRSFCLIFSLSFLTSIFHRFFLDFGGAWEGFWKAQTIEKSRFSVFFGVCFWRPYFWAKFRGISTKDGEKHMEFYLFFSHHCYFIICLLNLLFPLKLETLKLVIFLLGNACFNEI